MQWCFLPFVRDVDKKILLATEAADCFDRVNVRLDELRLLLKVGIVTTIVIEPIEAPAVESVTAKAIVVCVVIHAESEVVVLLNLVDQISSFLPVFNLDKCVVKRHSVEVVLLVDVDPQIDQELLGLKRGVSSSAGHVDCFVQQVTTLVVAEIDVCSSSTEACDFIVFATN